MNTSAVLSLKGGPAAGTLGGPPIDKGVCATFFFPFVGRELYSMSLNGPSSECQTVLARGGEFDALQGVLSVVGTMIVLFVLLWGIVSVVRKR